MRDVTVYIVCSTFFCSRLLLAQPQVISPELAARHFKEAEEVSAKDNGQLWHERLYGSMLFVDPETHAVVANQADAEGKLAAKGAVFIGELPRDVNVANTSIEWAGMRWTMLVWPLPEEAQERVRLMMHESFHRIQERLSLPAASPANAHLETEDGRIWLQVEWRALERALTETGAERKRALGDALLFRSYRQSLFPAAAREEKELELNEGLAEYTGLRLSSHSPREMPFTAFSELRNARGRASVARSFAYVSGPAYGALLDESGMDWRAGIKGSDFAALVRKAYAIPATEITASQARARAWEYDGDEVIAAETARRQVQQREEEKARARFIQGPVLILPVGKTFSYSFDPNRVLALGDAGIIYVNTRVSDDWGILEAPGGALLVRESGLIVRVQVPAPLDLKARPLKGEDWTLGLLSGWETVPSGRVGDYTLQKKEPTSP